MRFESRAAARHAASRPRGSLTFIDAQVLARVSMQLPPWRGDGVALERRSLRRLWRKGFVRQVWSLYGFSKFRSTTEGETALAVAFEFAMRGKL